MILKEQQNHEKKAERERERLLSRYVAREVESKTSSGEAQDIEPILVQHLKKQPTVIQSNLQIQ